MKLSDFIMCLTETLAERGDSEIIFSANEKGAFDAVDVSEISLKQGDSIERCLEFSIRSSNKKNSISEKVNNSKSHTNIGVEFESNGKVVGLDNFDDLGKEEKESFINFLKDITESDLSDLDVSSFIKGVKIENGVATPIDVNSVDDLPDDVKESLLGSLKGLAKRLEEEDDDYED